MELSTHHAFMCSAANLGVNVIPLMDGITILVGDTAVLHIAQDVSSI